MDLLETKKFMGMPTRGFIRAMLVKKEEMKRTIPEERQKKYEKSIEHFTQAIILEPNFFEAYHNRGVIYSKKEL